MIYCFRFFVDCFINYSIKFFFLKGKIEEEGEINYERKGEIYKDFVICLKDKLLVFLENMFKYVSFDYFYVV